jgi:peptidoglycan hydrolase-like protein with peptidoglycan-binding domain
MDPSPSIESFLFPAHRERLARATAAPAACFLSRFRFTRISRGVCRSTSLGGIPLKRLVLALVLCLVLVPVLAFASSTAPDNWEQVLKEKDDKIAELTEQLAQVQAQLDQLTATPAPTAEPTPAAYKPLKKGSKGDQVLALQNRLKELGYLGGTADGSYGGGTVTAIKDFQSAAGLEETGTADVDTQAALFADSAPKSPNPVLDETLYGKLDYKAFARDPDKYTGTRIKFSGKILQVVEDTFSVSFRIATKGGYDNVVYATYYPSEDYKRLLEDDSVVVYAVYSGIYSYEAVMGNTVSVPSCMVDRIILK